LDLNEVTQSDSTKDLNAHVFNNLVNRKDIKGLKEKPLTKETTPGFHLIGSGESLGLIAQKYGIQLSDLFILNPGLKKNQHRIQKGQKIRIRKEIN
jgi:LysM repeat protein